MLNEANMRLERALREARPETVRQFFKLALTHIPLGIDRHGPQPSGGGGPSGFQPVDSSIGPVTKALCAELHEQVEGLPEDPRELVDRRFYHGLWQSEVAEILGVSERQVKRSWWSCGKRSTGSSATIRLDHDDRPCGSGRNLATAPRLEGWLDRWAELKRLQAR